MQNYLFNTDIGTFEIRQVEHELYQLWLKDEMMGEYASPEKAAEDVAGFDSGNPEWDKLENKWENVPHSLADWTPVTEETPEA